MTIDEAIRILQDILTYVKPGDPPEEHDAIKLGIKALKEKKCQHCGGRGVVIVTGGGRVKCPKCGGTGCK